MEITVRLTADESALEFARLLGGALSKIEKAPKKETATKVEVSKKEESKPSVTLEACREKAAAVMATDPQKFKEALKAFEIRKVPELAPEQYEAFMEFMS